MVIKYFACNSIKYIISILLIDGKDKHSCSYTVSNVIKKRISNKNSKQKYI